MGGSSRRPLDLAVVGGLVISQVPTLCVTPVIYICMGQISAWRRQSESVAVVDGGGEVVAKKGEPGLASAAVGGLIVG